MYTLKTETEQLRSTKDKAADVVQNVSEIILECSSIYACTVSHGVIIMLQWNPSITDTFGEQSFGHYTEVAFVEGLFCIQTLYLGPVYLAVISQLAFLQGWPLGGVPLLQ